MTDLVIPSPAAIVALLILGAACAPRATGCELDRAVRRYWSELRAGDVVVSEALTEGRTHRSTMRTTAQVRGAGEELTLEVRERLEGVGKPLSGEAIVPRVVTETIVTYALVEEAGKAAVLRETRISLDDGKRSAPRVQTVPLEKAANRLPGVASYCVEEPALASEAVETPAGRYNAKRYRAGDTDVWVSPDVPLGGLVRMRAAAGEETVDQRVVRVVKGRR